MQRTTTLKEVADACGVNIMTVARALRPGSSVAAETRAKVIEESRRLGYVPRPNFGRPRSLASITRPVVDVILGDHVASTFMHGLLDVICRELGRRSYDCLIRSAKGDFDDFLRLCESMRADRERTTMIVGYVPTSQLRVLLEVRPNALLVDHTGDPRVDVPCHSIGFDNAEAARQVVGHLATRGYRRILLINGIPGHYFTREVTHGYYAAVREHDLTVDPDLVIDTDFSQAQAVAAIEGALARGLSFDAVMANDDMAIAVMAALQRQGRRIPHDVAVAGIDGLPLGEFTVPSLTTARLDYAELGRQAAMCVCDEKSLSTTPIRKRLLPQLCIRDSTTKEF